MPTLSIVTNTPAPDPLATLHAEKADLGRQVEELTVLSARLLALEEQEAAALAAIGDIGRREVAAMTEWASAGCAGDPPPPLTQERAAAAQALSAASRQKEAGSQASAEIEARRAALQMQIAEIAARIDDAIIDALEAECCAARERFHLALADVRLIAAVAFGNRAVILSQAEDLNRRGLIEHAKTLYRRVEAFDRIGIDLDASPLVGDVQEATATAAANALAMKGNRRETAN